MSLKEVLINKYHFCPEKAEIIQSIYDRCNERKLLDTHFMKELTLCEGKMKQRISELLLGDFLLSRGLPLDEGKDKGPDYIFSLEGRRYNVELITPFEKIIPENATGLIHYHGRDIEAEMQVLHNGELRYGEKYEVKNNSLYERFKLRLNESLKSKFKAYKESLKKGFVKKTDVNIICVNSSFCGPLAIGINGKDVMESNLFGVGSMNVDLSNGEVFLDLRKGLLSLKKMEVVHYIILN